MGDVWIGSRSCPRWSKRLLVASGSCAAIRTSSLSKVGSRDAGPALSLGVEGGLEGCFRRSPHAPACNRARAGLASSHGPPHHFRKNLYIGPLPARLKRWPKVCFADTLKAGTVACAHH